MKNLRNFFGTQSIFSQEGTFLKRDQSLNSVSTRRPVSIEKNLRNFFIFCLLLLPITGHAKLSEDFRKNFTEIIQDLCNSSIDYSIDDTTGIEYDSKKGITCPDGKCREYQDTMACLFKSAFSESLKGTNSDVLEHAEAKSLEKILKKFNLPFDTKTCEGKSLGELQIKQKQRGFTSTCTETPSLNAVYSPCKVAETALLEYCGYQKFLASKMLDRISYQNENPDNKSLYIPDGIQKLYGAEIQKSESALVQMLEYYRNFQQKYWLDVWLNALIEEIRPLQSTLVKIWKNISTFPDKFVNPSRDF